MQQQRVIRFYKVLGDPTRLQIVLLLAEGELHGQALAARLGVGAPTVTHHIGRLRQAGLVSERREGNAIYFRVNYSTLAKDSQALLTELGLRHARTSRDGASAAAIAASSAGSEPFPVRLDEFDKSLSKKLAAVLRRCLTPEGRVKHIPDGRKKRVLLWRYLVDRLLDDRLYTQDELSEIIGLVHDDWVTVLDEWVQHRLVVLQHGQFLRVMDASEVTDRS